MPHEYFPKRYLSLQEVTDAAKETLLEQGAHAPLVIADGEREAVFTHIEQMSPDQEERLSQMLLLGLLLAETGKVGVLYQVFFITEGWLGSATRHRSALQRPSQDPERKEILVVSHQIVHPRQTHIAMSEMKRDATGRLIRLENFNPYSAPLDTVKAESPLLDAFTTGFLRALNHPSAKDN